VFNLPLGVKVPCFYKQRVLAKANLTKANLSGVNLTEANLRGARLHYTKLYGANLHRAYYDESTKFPRNFDPLSHNMQKL